MTNRRRMFQVCGLGAAFLLGAGDVSQSCSHVGPESVLDRERATLRRPIASFEMELRRLEASSKFATGPADVLDPVASSEAGEPLSRMVEVETEELNDVLADEAGGQRHEAVENYRELRQAMLAKYWRNGDAGWSRPYVSQRGTDLLAGAEKGEWDANWPVDVVLYLQGALQYHQQDKAAAVETWKRLLDLPENERQNRSVAAAWMIAKTLMDTEGLAAALPWYERCIRLSHEGYRDCLRLGRAAVGWEARYYLDRGERRKALELYYQQAMAGESGAWDSLRQSVPEVDQLTDAELAKWAGDSFLRQLLTASQLSGASRFSLEFLDGAESDDAGVKRWLEALERADVDEVAEAAQFAELAYSSGYFDLAKRWLKLAAVDDGRALWVRGKLALMEGDTRGAEKDLLAAQTGFYREKGSRADSIVLDNWISRMPVSMVERYRTSQFYGDLGAVLLSQDRYAEALTAFLKGGFFDDAAYVAERLMSPEELLTYVRSQGAVAGKVEQPEDNMVERLLARRLARLRYFKDARPFVPGELLPVFDRYADLVRTSRSRAPRAERSTALWEAAQIHRVLGMELFGTEGEPDMASLNGSGTGSSYLQSRLGVEFSKSPAEEQERRVLDVVPAVTPDERTRVRQSRMPHEERFQYRYAAADMAWQAAKLMPDKSEETARVLGTAGRWLALRDPQAADRFYKAMIWRNWSTPLAREADRKKWFPEMAWTYDPWAAAGVERPERY